MEAITRPHFLQHGKPDCHDDVKKECHFCQLRTFPTHSTAPVSIVNEIPGDTSTLPSNFRFIKEVLYGPGVTKAPDVFLSGCECKDDRHCQYAVCGCLDEVEPDNNLPEPRKLYAFHTHGAKKGLLRSNYLASRQPIYECHDDCKCSRQCPNRVVERGRTVPLQIFRTRDRGWGVRCPIDIKRGQFVDKYLGEVIVSAEADTRRKQSKRAQRKDVYLFALDKFIDPTSPDPRLVGPPLEVDGEFCSGPTRFINHSCEPNLRIFARVGDHANKHLHDLALFAVKDISRGEELTFDYVDGQAEEEMDAYDKDLRTVMTECKCGSEKCRGRLW